MQRRSYTWLPPGDWTDMTGVLLTGKCCGEPCDGCKQRRVEQNAKHPSRQTQKLLTGAAS